MAKTTRDIGLLVLRLGVGGALAAHGSQKLFGWFGGYGPDGTGQFMQSLGFPGDGRTNAILSGLAEFGGGALLALGLGTGPAGAAVTANMAVAGSTHAPNGFFNTSGGYEVPATFGLVGTALALTGPGKLSLDSATGNVFNKPWLTVLAFAATLGSAAYLIANRTQTEPDPEDAAAAESSADEGTSPEA